MSRFAVLAAFLAHVGMLAPAQAGEGATLFEQNCLMCHQSGAVGLAGQFPRLAGRVSAVSDRAAGRAYLIDVLTYGLVGKITVDDQTIIGLMPPFAQLPDDTVADILSYVQSLGDVPAKPPIPFTAKEVAAGRARPPKAADEVQAERQMLVAQKILP